MSVEGAPAQQTRTVCQPSHIFIGLHYITQAQRSLFYGSERILAKIDDNLWRYTIFLRAEFLLNTPKLKRKWKYPNKTRWIWQYMARFNKKTNQQSLITLHQNNAKHKGVHNIPMICNMVALISSYIHVVMGAVLEYVHEPGGPAGVYMGKGSIGTVGSAEQNSWSQYSYKPY